MLAHEHGLGSETLSPSSVDKVLLQTNPDFTRLHQSLLEFINISEC